MPDLGTMMMFMIAYGFLTTVLNLLQYILPLQLIHWLALTSIYHQR